MNIDAIQAFLAKPRDAIIATNRVGKGSQLNPVWFLWDGEAFLFSTQKGSAKYGNIVRDPHISVIVNDPVTHTYVTAYGRAEIVALEHYPEFEHAILEKYIPMNQRQQFTAATQTIEHAERVVIVLKSEKVVGRTWTI